MLRTATALGALALMSGCNLDVAAPGRQRLESDARRIGGVRVLDGRFMAIEQTMGTPRARAAGAAYLRAFVEEAKASGLVAQALARHGIDCAVVVPARGLG